LAKRDGANCGGESGGKGDNSRRRVLLGRTRGTNGGSHLVFQVLGQKSAGTSPKAIAASPGAAASVDSSQFDTNLAESADCILLEGMLFSKENLVAAVLDFCVTHDKPLAIACATPFGADQVGRVLSSRKTPVPRLFLFANEAEWARLRARKIEPGIFPNMVCLETRGDQGGSLWEGRTETRWRPAEIPGPLVDESGAGDVFAGAFLTQYLAHQNADALVLAARLAAAVCAVPLCQTSDQFIVYKR
jgi:sugar/nucleoside kinase (ribokinase family)